MLMGSHVMHSLQVCCEKIGWALAQGPPDPRGPRVVWSAGVVVTPLHGYTVLERNQSPRPIQRPMLSETENTHYSQRAVAVLCNWEGNRRSGVAPAMHHASQASLVFHLQAQ